MPSWTHFILSTYVLENTPYTVWIFFYTFFTLPVYVPIKRNFILVVAHINFRKRFTVLLCLPSCAVTLKLRFILVLPICYTFLTSSCSSPHALHSFFHTVPIYIHIILSFILILPTYCTLLYIPFFILLPLRTTFFPAYSMQMTSATLSFQGCRISVAKTMATVTTFSCRP
jgi:hypothetical protein